MPYVILERALGGNSMAIFFGRLKSKGFSSGMSFLFAEDRICCMTVVFHFSVDAAYLFLATHG